MEEVHHLTIIIKWGGKIYYIRDLTEDDTVEMLRHEIFKATEVRPHRQKLLNLPKLLGKPAPDTAKIGEIKIKDNFSLMLMGSTEADILMVTEPYPEDVGEVRADFQADEECQLIENSPIYLAKVQRRIREYKINELASPREGKRLLVLDIDYTLFDHRSAAETGAELMRPYLHEFLCAAYEDYDIVIWSATGMRWIEEKMRLLGVSGNELYKIMFYLDSNAMISVHTPERGIFDVKPLGLIWGLYPQYSPKNTIMFDDIRRNFYMNPRSGLRVRPFRQAHLNRATDKELIKLLRYLRRIARHCDDFTKLKHQKWESYDPK